MRTAFLVLGILLLAVAAARMNMGADDPGPGRTVVALLAGIFAIWVYCNAFRAPTDGGGAA